MLVFAAVFFVFVSMGLGYKRKATIVYDLKCENETSDVHNHEHFTAQTAQSGTCLTLVNQSKMHRPRLSSCIL